MQGYISGIVKLKNEDIVVKIITKSKFLSLYRFYGIRHSIINIGRKIDFEIDYSGIFMPRLRNILQIGFEWEHKYNRLYFWQSFLKLINKHLQDTNEISSFYFDLLDEMSIKFQKQNPYRILLDSYAKLLEFEGRKILETKCFVCNQNLGENSVIVRSFLAAHKSCIPYSLESIDTKIFFDFLKSNRSICLNNAEVKYLLNIMLEGL